MDLILDVELDPRQICTAQQKGACIIGKRIRFFTKRTVAESNKRIKAAVLDAMRRAGVDLLQTVSASSRGKRITNYIVANTVRRSKALRLDVTYYFPWQESAPKRIKSHDAFMVERPDLDNLTKSFQDCLTELRLWDDDSQIAVLHLEKHRTDGRPRVALRVRTLADCGNPEGSCLPDE